MMFSNFMSNLLGLEGNFTSNLARTAIQKIQNRNACRYFHKSLSPNCHFLSCPSLSILSEARKEKKKNVKIHTKAVKICNTDEYKIPNLNKYVHHYEVFQKFNM